MNWRPEFLPPWSVFDIASKEQEIARLEKRSAEPEFWLNQTEAQSVMRQAAELKKVVSKWRGVEKRVADTGELLTL
ncbi:MAG TPA: PCRF domain-containing protein, partial [Dehalococcoidales bacterium]